MKKIGVFLGVLFMGLLIFVRSPAPARADAWVLPFSKVPDIIEMAQTLFSGGKLEFSSIISDFSSLDDIIEMWQDFKDRLAYSQTVERANTTLSGLVELAKSGISAIESSTDFVLPFKYEDAAAFIQYNPLWYLQNVSWDSGVTPEPDIDYLTYLDSINGDGFWFVDFPISTRTYNNVTASNLKVSPDNISWFIPTNATSYFRDTRSDIYSVYTSQIFDINIYGSGDSYTFNQTVSVTTDSGMFNFLDNGSNFGTTACRGGIYLNSDRFVVFDNNAVNLSYYITGDLATVFNYIKKYFRNVNVYVNGVIWSYAGTALLPPVLAPDVINVGDTGEVTYDVYGLEMPGDLGLDIPNFIDWILNKLQEGATTISLDDAITEDVPLVKTVDGVRAINYEDTRPVERVIEITLDDPDPNPTPTPNPDDPTPPILKLPTFNMMPAPHETTVLSELIDATQKTVPEELINLIWNCFGLLVIGGLIFILHK